MRNKNQNHEKKTKGIFVTGSGTDVGKTFVCGRLLRGFLRLGYRATYMKPVETGCGRGPDGSILAGADTRGLLEMTEYRTDIGLHSPYRFEPACSPHLAARLAGYYINVNHIAAAYGELCEKTGADAVVVEGAGGVLAPINNNEYMTNVMAALKIPAVLVTEAGLGTLNHTLLSLKELERSKIPVAGVVINNVRGAERDYILEDNIETIRQYVAKAACLIVDYNDNTPPVTEFCDDLLSRA